MRPLNGNLRARVTVWRPYHWAVAPATDAVAEAQPLHRRWKDRVVVVAAAAAASSCCCIEASPRPLRPRYFVTRTGAS
jgi:hypothetical protein